jgi:hypothetical protein
MTPRLFFDIETRANPAALAHLPEPEAPANYKDPAKIAAYLAEKKAQLAAQAALDPDTGHVSSIAYRLDENDQTHVQILVPHPGDVECVREADSLNGNLAVYLYDGHERDQMERALLEAFWAAFAETDGYCAGYNLLGFDLPFLLRRSMTLGVKPPAILPRMAKYQSDPVRDLYGLLYNWQPGKGLKAVAKLHGLPNPLPDLDGGSVAVLDWKTEAAYVANDVALVMALYRRMDGYYWPKDGDDEFPF